jgi:hypothetical protein
VCEQAKGLAAIHLREEPDALMSARPGPSGGYPVRGIPTGFANYIREVWCLMLVRGHCMKKWALISGPAGILWMVFLLYSKSFRLAIMSNYPGAFAAKWVHYRGIAPSAGTVLAFNIWQ